MKIKLIFLAMILFGFRAFAQELPRVIPPSPTAASLARYGELPVSIYTGVPNISIPLYDIRSGEIELPITLSYHASGIKVAQEASSVGLCWSLNAGGAITRSVLGVDDLKAGRGYPMVDDLASTSSDLPANYDIAHEDYQEYLLINSGQRDGQPDMFYYNFMGMSGKMIFDKKEVDSNVIKGIPLEQTNTRFAYNIDQEEWEVTDSKGWKYYFNVKEMSFNHNSRDLYYSHYSNGGNGSFLYNVDRMDELSSQVWSDRFISSWYLTKIETPKGDVMVFEYDQESEHGGISQMSYYEQESYYGNPLYERGENLWCGYFTEYKYSVTASMQSFDNINLKKIVFNNGYIEFETSDREDLRQKYYLSQYYPKAQKIESFEVFDLLDKSVKRIDFNYSYFNENITGDNKENHWRLRLDGVQESFYNETTGTYVNKPPYTFNYNSISLPAKTSAAIDHWGYYNAFDNDHANSYTDLTKEEYDSPVIVDDETSSGSASQKYFRPFQIECRQLVSGTRYPFLNGAYREPNAQKMQAAVLNQINYPTGGATRFTYSPNEYIPPTDVDFSRYEYNKFSLFHEGLGDADTKDFTLNYHTAVKIDCNIFNYGGSHELENVEALIEMSTGEDVIRFSPQDDDFSKKVQLILPPGNYKAFAKTNAGGSMVEIFMTVEFVQQFWTDKKIGGGLRIEAQEALDTSGDVVKKKSYSYQNGRAMSQIQYFYKDVGFSGESFYFLNPTTSSSEIEDVIVRSSSTETPLSSSAQGNFVGYDKVSVSDVDQPGNPLGKSEYYYTNTPDESGNGIFKLPGFPVITHMNNGNLLERRDYSSSGDLLKKTETTYKEDESTMTMVKGIYTRNVLKEPRDGFSSGGPLVRFYRMYSEWWYPDKEVEVLYDVDGGNPVTTTAYYYYNNSAHKNLTSIEKENSKGEILKTTYQYPPDLVNEEQTTLMQDLEDQNIISQPVITKTFLDDTKTSEIHIKYENSANTGNITLPVEIHALNGNGNIDISEDDDLALIYYKYDENGNPLEVGKADDMHVAYIWGYNNRYPIAKAENATENQIAYTSFENGNNEGGWQFTNSTNTSHFKTGRKSHGHNSYNITKTGLPSGNYILSFWAKRSSTSSHEVIVNGTTKAVNTETWTYFEVPFSGTSVTVDPNNVYLDELRLYPANAHITTYTYDPLVGMTSQTDPSGIVTFYEYDNFGRLKNVKDEKGNILQNVEYHFAGQ